MTIRVGIDGSGPSRAALAWALRRSARLAEPVVLMHVRGREWAEAGRDSARAQRADGAWMLEQAMHTARAIAPDSDVTTQLLDGSIAWSLVQQLAPHDLIVVGTHKTGYLRGRVLGTQSIVIASLAKCRVAVIPDVDLAARHDIVIGIADGDAWSAAVRTGADEAARTGQNISLIHATDDTEDASSSRALLAAAAALAAETAPGASIRRRISQRNPTDALLDASQAATLLVLGASRRNPEGAAYIGSITHDVLLNINAPVLLAR